MSRFVLIFSALTLVPAASSWAGIIRHDVPDASYTDLAAQYPAVGMFKSDEEIKGSGVLITPEWVLTAAHFSLGNGLRTFTVDGHVREVAELIRHPDWVNPNIPEGYDLSLVKLDAPVFDVPPALLPESPFSVLGRTATYTGYGETGDGRSGSEEDSSGTLRAGKNRIDSMGGRPTDVTYSNNVAWADFDGDGFNQIGPSTPLPLEYLTANFDSGGGVFVEEDGQQILIGVNSTVLLFNSDGDIGLYEYGDQMGTTLVSPSLTWIMDTALPTPLLGDADNDLRVTGLDLIMVQQHFGTIGVADGLLLGDANDDGKVTGADLVTVQENFGAMLGGGTVMASPFAGPITAPIPEPSAILALAATFFLARRRA